MKLTAILLATALLWASHVPASGQLRNVTDNAAGISYNANSKTVLGAYTVGKDDHTILANAAAGAFTITLPAPNSRANPYLVVKKIDATANAVTLDPAGSATIDGASTISLGAQYQQVILHANATGWHILNGGGLLRGDTVLSSDSTGGNLGASSTLTASLNIKLVPFATMTDGTASVKTKSLMDDTPAGEWSAIGGGTADPTPANDATYARVGTNSLKLPFLAAAVAGDGAKFTAYSAENWEAQESVGMWVRSSVALTAGDVVLKTVDSTGDVSFNMPAVAANIWTWVEFDISALAAGTGDAVTNVKLALSTAGAALGVFNLWIDGAYKWDATEELALGVDLLDQPGSVKTVLTQVKADAGTQAHDMAALVEGTDYFVHYESGNDSIVTISDQSTKSGFGLVVHK